MWFENTNYPSMIFQNEGLPFLLLNALANIDMFHACCCGKALSAFFASASYCSPCVPFGS